MRRRKNSNFGITSNADICPACRKRNHMQCHIEIPAAILSGGRSRQTRVSQEMKPCLCNCTRGQSRNNR